MAEELGTYLFTNYSKTDLSQDEWFRNVHKFCFLHYIKQSEETLMSIFLMIVLEFKYIWIFFYTLSSCCYRFQIYLILLLRNEPQNEICSSNVCSTTISAKYSDDSKRTYRIGL